MARSVTYEAEGNGRVVVAFDPSEYATDLVCVWRDETAISLHTNGHNHLTDDGDLHHGQLALLDQPEGAHVYAVSEYDPNEKLGRQAEGSEPTQVEVT